MLEPFCAPSSDDPSKFVGFWVPFRLPLLVFLFFLFVCFTLCSCIVSFFRSGDPRLYHVDFGRCSLFLQFSPLPDWISARRPGDLAPSSPE
ncbi:hypothetical protein SLEP1_g41998 [Rubroshorea leprosula]|uniref:Transmembrane protein n=1 Tax=Rubroshorea leprosula TaxID=152421 RepID=A0AAV5L8B7_9ROSI|nr:hypothetical protein SLEP1_g41998 [Rubroshorea leprosula]